MVFGRLCSEVWSRYNGQWIIIFSQNWNGMNSYWKCLLKKAETNNNEKRESSGSTSVTSYQYGGGQGSSAAVNVHPGCSGITAVFRSHIALFVFVFCTISWFRITSLFHTWIIVNSYINIKTRGLVWRKTFCWSNGHYWWDKTLWFHIIFWLILMCVENCYDFDRHLYTSKSNTPYLHFREWNVCLFVILQGCIEIIMFCLNLQ